MTNHFSASFDLCDPLNSGFGYQVKIENACTGEVLLHRSNHPVTLGELLTPGDCLDLISWFVAPDKLESDTRCALCQETIPAGTLAADYAEHINHTPDLGSVESVDLAHRDCAADTGDSRWSYDK